MKKVLVILLVLIIVSVGGFLLFSRKNTVHVSIEASNYKAIPIDVPVFFEFNSLLNIPYKNKIFSSLENSGFFTSFFRLISRLDSATSIGSDPSVKNEPFLVALNLEGRDNYIPLIIAKAENGTKKRNLESITSRLFPPSKYQSRKREYNGEVVFDLVSGNPNEAFSYSFARGLFIASPKSIVVEKALRQLETEGLQDDAGFIQINKTATQQSQISIYINHKTFPGFIKNLINPIVTKSIDELGEEVNTNYKTSIASFANLASWSELDLTSKENEIRLYGVSVVPDSVGQYLAIFKRQDVIKSQIEEVLPSNTAMFFNLSINNKKYFFEDLEKFFGHTDGFYSREEKIKKINLLAGSDLVSVFENLIDNEVAMSFTEVPGEPSQKNSCFIISTRGKSEAKDEMAKWMAKYAQRNIRFNKNSTSFKIDRESVFDIYNFPYPSFPGIWLGKPFNSISANVFTYYDNYIIFANTRAALENQLRELTLGSTLAKDADYIALKQNIENKSNLTFYLNVNNGYNLNKEFFSEDITKRFKSKDAYLRKFGSLTWQVCNSSNILFNNIYLNYSDEVRVNSKTTWQSNIGANIVTKPQIVTGKDRKRKEVIVQDVNNILHLITADGRAKWGIPIPEKIIGEIKEIDFRKDGGSQFLFNTKSKIYLIDHDGNNIAPYPLVLRSPATNEISIIDFDNNKNYRFFIAGEDKKIYAFESTGKLSPGWNFGKTDQVVTTPIQYFKVEGKEYIVFKDRVRFYFTDRKGKTNLKIQTKFENSQNPIVFDRTGTAKMVVTDIKGMVYYIYFNGRVVAKKTSPLSENHFFTAADIDGNGILDFIFADKDMLSVVDEKGTKLFASKFNSNISCPPEIYLFPPKAKKIGVICQGENQIYLLNTDGSFYKGFPMKGSSRFNIGQMSADTKFRNLFVGSNDGKIYNYRLD